MDRRPCFIVGVCAVFLAFCAVPSDAQLKPMPDYCSELQTEMASALRDFDYCALNNSRPFTVCLRCAKPYERAATLFGDFIAGKSDLSVNCSMLIDGGKLSLVTESFLHIEQIWKIYGACDSCYEPNSFNVTGAVQEFFEQRGIVQRCLESFTPVEKNQTCLHCRPEFRNLTHFFTDMVHSETEHRHSVCLDVLDAMNETRHEWANTCFERSHSMTPDVIVAMTLMFAFTLAFYLGMRLSQDPKDIELARVNTYQSMKLEENSSSADLVNGLQPKASQSNSNLANLRRQADFDPAFSAVPTLSVNFV